MARTATLFLVSLLAAVGQGVIADEVILRVLDTDGSAARVAAPVSVEVDLGQLIEGSVPDCRLELSPVDGSAQSATIPAQFEPEAPESKRGRLWWIMPKGPAGERRFRLTSSEGKVSPVWQLRHDRDRQAVEVAELSRPVLPVLRYNHGSVPVPEGTHAHFAKGESYERGDYIHPLFGPHGEKLTDDYPADHPHHRGVWWSWPVTRWKDQIADIWAVVGVWARPVAPPQVCHGPLMVVIEAENVWKFGKSEEPIVREKVLIRAFRQSEGCRYVDVEVSLTALVDDVAIGGRPKSGYGGFSLRAAPCEGREISPHMDPETSSPRRAWVDYSGAFDGQQRTSGTAIFEHITNPDYPNPLHESPACTTVMPAYPDKREVVLSKDKAVVLKHRLWVHAEGPKEDRLADVWASYARPPQVTVIRQSEEGKAK